MKNFEWDDLRVFLAVYRGKSVRAAAKLMGVSHSTISRRLASMEEQLGTTLFIRQADGFSLTEVGDAIVERAERVESEIQGMQREVFGRSASLAGQIRVSAIPHIVQHLLMPIVYDFTRQYPEVDVIVESSYQVANLSKHDADVAIRIQESPDEHLIGHRLPSIASAVYASPEYIAQHNFTGKTPSAEWVGWIANSKEMKKWHDETQFSGCKLKHSVYDPTAHLQAVKLGLGCSILFCFIGDNEPAVERLPEQVNLKLNSSWVLSHPDVFKTERIRVFVRFLRDEMYKIEQALAGQI
ncbi:LysR family transcriptional regulator [Vibrio sp. T187]|uniref:LysR family transcriptional regulator n=1 Tax=Vibrio TaxID=662 RepID=UPI0010C9BE7F|nr:MULTISPECIES: LysR family transcriptional regulator [Vibrio]MBW3694987.1 LysR family transcriptional regulator [Vibrio sp. T187]